LLLKKRLKIQKFAVENEHDLLFRLTHKSWFEGFFTNGLGHVILSGTQSATKAQRAAEEASQVAAASNNQPAGKVIALDEYAGPTQMPSSCVVTRRHFPLSGAESHSSHGQVGSLLVGSAVGGGSQANVHELADSVMMTSSPSRRADDPSSHFGAHKHRRLLEETRSPPNTQRGSFKAKNDLANGMPMLARPPHSSCYVRQMVPVPPDPHTAYSRTTPAATTTTMQQQQQPQTGSTVVTNTAALLNPPVEETSHVVMIKGLPLNRLKAELVQVRSGLTLLNSFPKNVLFLSTNLFSRFHFCCTVLCV
ncbi:hypothetical protein Ciccas_013503, partial [Cichlidogyrus casuarinus]